MHNVYKFPCARNIHEQTVILTFGVFIPDIGVGILYLLFLVTKETLETSSCGSCHASIAEWPTLAKMAKDNLNDKKLASFIATLFSFLAMN